MSEVARRMNMKPSTLQSAIEGNPTISTLRKIAEAARCQVAEFFADELAEAGLQIVSMGIQPQPRQDVPTEEPLSLPPTDKATPEQVLRFSYDCPHCGHKVRVTIE